jgi:hypothetical protein
VQVPTLIAKRLISTWGTTDFIEETGAARQD